MNWFKLIPALWKSKGFVEQEVREGKMIEENKPGWKKTEFYIKLFTVDLPLLWVSFKSLVPPATAMKIELIAGVVFMLFNTVQKGLENWKAVQQTTETTTVTPAPVSVTTTSPVVP